MNTSPMLAQAWTDPLDPWPFRPSDWVMEPKFDGWRALVSHTVGGNVELIGGRNGKQYPVPAPIEAKFKKLLPPGTTLDGEIIHPDGWGGVQGAMTRDNSTERDRLTLVVFDVLEINQTNTRSLGWQDRRDLLEIIQWPEPTLYLSPVMEPTLANYELLLEQGMEGAMLKHTGVGYVSGRNAGWRKLKATDTVDATCVGFQAGEGEFSELVGAMKVKLPNGVETTVSGMTMDVRKAMTADPVSYLFKTVEIKHNGELDSGKVRHPRFVRMREDRDSDEATPVETNPVPATATLPKPRRASSKAWMRNYSAMGDTKLIDAVNSLRNGYGDAHQRVIDRGGDLAQHLNTAENEARHRGLIS